MANAIPIQNLYYLLCYAWEHYNRGGSDFVSKENCPNILDLFSHILVQATQRLIRRGISRDYIPEENEQSAIRGRVLLGESLYLIMNKKPRMHCAYDEFSPNTLHNQILYASLLRIIKTDAVNNITRHKLASLARLLTGIQPIRLSKDVFKGLQYHRHNAFYQFIMRICEFILDATLPDPTGNQYVFDDIVRDEKKMALVFESFIRNFYASEQNDFQVFRKQFSWDAKSQIDPDLKYLPQMNTDVNLYSKRQNRMIILDAKYYKECLQKRYDVLKAHSANLYQMYAYLKNSEKIDPIYKNAEGVLLYPCVEQPVDLKYEIDGHPIRIATIDLNQPWQNIHNRMMSLLTA